MTDAEQMFEELYGLIIGYECEFGKSRKINNIYKFVKKIEKELEELAKYKRAFEILKEILSMHKDTSLNGEVDFYTLYFTGELPYECYKHLTKEEYELLEELMENDK